MLCENRRIGKRFLLPFSSSAKTKIQLDMDNVGHVGELERAVLIVVKVRRCRKVWDPDVGCGTYVPKHVGEIGCVHTDNMFLCWEQCMVLVRNEHCSQTRVVSRQQLYDFNLSWNVQEGITLKIFRTGCYSRIRIYRQTQPASKCSALS